MNKDNDSKSNLEKHSVSGEQPQKEAPSRREALRTLGLLTGAAFTGLSTDAALAQRKRAPIAAKLISPRIRLNTATVAQLKDAVRLSARLAETTPITRMRLTKANVSNLTPAARRLTKADLVALAKVQAGLSTRLSPAAEALTVKDVRSIRAVFIDVAAVGGIGGVADIDVSCCCCTPCCCAAAVTDSDRPVA